MNEVEEGRQVPFKAIGVVASLPIEVILLEDVDEAMELAIALMDKPINSSRLVGLRAEAYTYTALHNLRLLIHKEVDGKCRHCKIQYPCSKIPTSYLTIYFHQRHSAKREGICDECGYDAPCPYIKLSNAFFLLKEKAGIGIMF